MQQVQGNAQQSTSAGNVVVLGTSQTPTVTATTATVPGTVLQKKIVVVSRETKLPPQTVVAAPTRMSYFSTSYLILKKDGKI